MASVRWKFLGRFTDLMSLINRRYKMTETWQKDYNFAMDRCNWLLHTEILRVYQFGVVRAIHYWRAGAECVIDHFSFNTIINIETDLSAEQHRANHGDHGSRFLGQIPPADGLRINTVFTVLGDTLPMIFYEVSERCIRDRQVRCLINTLWRWLLWPFLSTVGSFVTVRQLLFTSWITPFWWFNLDGPRLHPERGSSREKWKQNS